MLIEESFQLTLQTSKMKILKVLPALNSSFVLLVVIRPGADEQILHIDKTGRELYSYQSIDTINQITMLNDHTVVFCDVAESMIGLINLQTRIRRNINHEYFSDCTAAINLEFFSDTKLLCLVERGTPEHHRMMISYYRQMDDSPLQYYETQEGEFRHQDLVTKGNSHSMIIWSGNCMQDVIVFWTYDLWEESKRQNGKKCSRKFSVSNPQHVPNQTLTSFVNIWESTRDCFIMATNCNKQKVKPDRANNTNLHYDSKKDIIRPVNFHFDGTDNQRLIEQQNLGEYSVFPVFQYQSGVAIQTPVYFVQNENEKIIKILVWKSESNYQLFKPGYEPNCLLMAEFTPGDVKDMKIHFYKFLSRKDAYLNMLLCINEDFDDDLLSDAVELLAEDT